MTSEKRQRGRPRQEGLDEAILAAAAAHLLEQGAQVFSLLEVAQQAGVPKSTVYRRWPTQRAMLVAAVAQLAADLPEFGSEVARCRAMRPAHRLALRAAVGVACDPELSR